MTEPHPPAGGWRIAEVRTVEHPNDHAVRLRLTVPDRVVHLPGQHYVVRLTAEDGYTASRSYSVASAPEDDLVELYVERLEDGEVSGFLADVVEPGDTFEVRGPIGGWFAWSGHRPALCVGGGTGVVPLVAMLRHAQAMGQPDLLAFVVAGRTMGDLPYAEELAATGAVVALSRTAYRGRPPGRLVPSDLRGLVRPGLRTYVCGSAGFAEAASALVVRLGVEPSDVRVERFGPTG